MMFIFGNLVSAIAIILDYALDIYMWIVIIVALLSWVNPDPYNSIVRFFRAITDPVLTPVRRVIGHRLGPIDISPLIVILAIVFVQKFLIRSLYEIAIKLKGGAFI
jgi:YggT family protein